MSLSAKAGIMRLRPNEGQEGDSLEGAAVNCKSFFGETESITIGIYVARCEKAVSSPVD